jgi:hypothetical protein
MIEIRLICDHTGCRKSAALFRHRDEAGGTWKLIGHWKASAWKLIGQWKTTAANDEMLHACSNEHAELIDVSTRGASVILPVDSDPLLCATCPWRIDKDTKDKSAKSAGAE